VSQVEFQTAATCCTPGTAAIARTAAGVTGAVAEPVVITASPPVACQDAATSPLAIALRSVPANVARLSASTSANAGSTPVSEVRAAPASATNPVAPARRADSQSRPRMTSGYSRNMTTTARIATSTGAAARNQSTLPPAGTPSSCSTTSPATAAAHAVNSATGRRSGASRARDVRDLVPVRDRAEIPCCNAMALRSRRARPDRPLLLMLGDAAPSVIRLHDLRGSGFP
jgi:hypothetical protein